MSEYATPEERKELLDACESLRRQCKGEIALAPAYGSEILRCPYCCTTSDDKDPLTQERAVISTTYSATNSCVVQCNWCGLSGPIFGTIDEAISAWKKIMFKSPNNDLPPITTTCLHDPGEHPK
jgi:hypothetical protein